MESVSVKNFRVNCLPREGRFSPSCHLVQELFNLYARLGSSYADGDNITLGLCPSSLGESMKVP